MTDTLAEGLFSAAQLGSSTPVGYRLDRLELFNWGTFDRRVWRLTPRGQTTLLTGDIGSGKSTLVDAVTTLLLPANRIAYNKAAGAESRERTLRSYVEGHYKSERIESTGTSRPIGLRDHHHYSVLLGVFVNDGYDEAVTIAQVFHQKDRAGQPDRFFVTAERDLSIEADFTGFGSDLTELRRRLRTGGASIETTYPDYAKRVRRLLGIRSDQALELFHQTVSMKSVGNLNEFVRTHMLEPVDATDKVNAIVAHFEDLTKAHEAVQRAKKQLAALDPLVATADRYDEALARRTGLETERDAVATFILELRLRLLGEEIDAGQEQVERLTEQVTASLQIQGDLTSRRDHLIAERAAAGGDRVAELAELEKQWRELASKRRAAAARLADHLTTAELAPVTTAADFAGLPRAVAGVRSDLSTERAGVEEQQLELAGRRREIDTAAGQIREELTSLAGRRNNLPVGQLELREALCADLGLEPESLPFAGELIDVADGHERWRGAAERVLRPFALSLLVPEEHYREVSAWVNGRRLTTGSGGRERGMRLVYERVSERRVRLRSDGDTAGMRLADTLEVAPGRFEDYLRGELVHRADHLCAESLTEFHEARRAVTEAGQVRSGDRHEKDDRRRVDDPRHWVLGWANERKIDALTTQLTALQDEHTGIETTARSLAQARDVLAARISALDKVETFTDFTDVDVATASSRAEESAAERERLLAGSNRLAEIERALEATDEELTEVGGRLEELRGQVSVQQDRLERARGEVARDEQRLAGTDAEVRRRATASFDALTARLGKALPGSSGECARAETELTGDLTRQIEQVGKEIGGYSTSLVKAMSEVRKEWPAETTEMDASVEARADYRKFRDRVANDDLPTFEDEFKRQLNTNTIRELAGFSSWLRRQADEIGARVARINDALGAIDYAAGRYITLVVEPTINTEIRDFRSSLRQATDDMLAPDDQYSEQRFLDVQAIIERFRGRPGRSESDKAWTRRVTDVRNWFTFSASERDRETDTEWEHYRDSDGKSGGQKEKLAYTILAASLAYQFGLEWGAEKSRDFRFAVIDEAFGRGSDVSTRYALELFAKLGLQLLIVTPLQKVHVIEPYVHSIGFVDNVEGQYSRLQNLSISEYREQRDTRVPGQT